MKYVLILTAAFAFASNVLADEDTIQMCIDMSKQKQAELSPQQRMSDKQIKAYCKCMVPKLEAVQAGKILTGPELTAMYQECGKKAGVKQKR